MDGIFEYCPKYFLQMFSIHSYFYFAFGIKISNELFLPVGFLIIIDVCNIDIEEVSNGPANSHTAGV